LLVKFVLKQLPAETWSVVHMSCSVINTAWSCRDCQICICRTVSMDLWYFIFICLL